MRCWKTAVLGALALVVLAGVLIGQEQGPNREPGATVSRPRKKDGGSKAEDSDLPKIPSRRSS